MKRGSRLSNSALWRGHIATPWNMNARVPDRVRESIPGPLAHTRTAVRSARRSETYKDFGLCWNLVPNKRASCCLGLSRPYQCAPQADPRCTTAAPVSTLPALDGDILESTAKVASVWRAVATCRVLKRLAVGRPQKVLCCGLLAHSRCSRCEFCFIAVLALCRAPAKATCVEPPSGSLVHNSPIGPAITSITVYTYSFVHTLGTALNAGQAPPLFSLDK